MAEGLSIDHPKQVIVEGNDDVRVLGALCRHLGISDVQIHPCGGYDSLSSFLRTFIVLPTVPVNRVRILVEDGDVLPIRSGIRVIHTPGHTRGSVCFLLLESGVLFSGDTIFSDGSRLSRSVPFPGYDREDYVRSLDRLSRLEFEGVCGGHGAPLQRGGSQILRQLLHDHPDPPTWGQFFRRLPRRIRNFSPLTGEHAERSRRERRTN